MVEKQTNKKLKKFRTDNGLEFCSDQFENYCRKEGIARHKTTIGTPQQNGLAERMNRTLLERVRCMLATAKLPKQFWAEVVTTTCYLVNRCHSSAIDLKTPQEMWYKKPSDYSNLKVFGCASYAHVRQDKLEPRALKCLFLGYPHGVKGFKLWCLEPGFQKCIISRDVTFNEFEFPGVKLKKQEVEKKNSFEIEVEPFGTRTETEIENDQ